MRIYNLAGQMGRELIHLILEIKKESEKKMELARNHQKAN